jgi:cytidine deaminase
MYDSRLSLHKTKIFATKRDTTVAHKHNSEEPCGLCRRVLHIPLFIVKYIEMEIEKKDTY